MTFKCQNSIEFTKICDNIAFFTNKAKGHERIILDASGKPIGTGPKANWFSRVICYFKRLFCCGQPHPAQRIAECTLKFFRDNREFLTLNHLDAIEALRNIKHASSHISEGRVKLLKALAHEDQKKIDQSKLKEIEDAENAVKGIYEKAAQTLSDAQEKATQMTAQAKAQLEAYKELSRKCRVEGNEELEKSKAAKAALEKEKNGLTEEIQKERKQRLDEMLREIDATNHRRIERLDKENASLVEQIKELEAKKSVLENEQKAEMEKHRAKIERLTTEQKVHCEGMTRETKRRCEEIANEHVEKLRTELAKLKVEKDKLIQSITAIKVTIVCSDGVLDHVPYAELRNTEFFVVRFEFAAISGKVVVAKEKDEKQKSDGEKDTKTLSASGAATSAAITVVEPITGPIVPTYEFEGPCVAEDYSKQLENGLSIDLRDFSKNAVSKYFAARKNHDRFPELTAMEALELQLLVNYIHGNEAYMLRKELAQYNHSIAQNNQQLIEFITTKCPINHAMRSFAFEELLSLPHANLVHLIKSRKVVCEEKLLTFIKEWLIRNSIEGSPWDNLTKRIDSSPAGNITLAGLIEADKARDVSMYEKFMAEIKLISMNNKLEKSKNTIQGISEPIVTNKVIVGQIPDGQKPIDVTWEIFQCEDFLKYTMAFKSEEFRIRSRKLYLGIRTFTAEDDSTLRVRYYLRGDLEGCDVDFRIGSDFQSHTWLKSQNTYVNRKVESDDPKEAQDTIIYTFGTMAQDLIPHLHYGKLTLGFRIHRYQK